MSVLLLLTGALLSGPLWMLKFGGLDLETHWSQARRTPDRPLVEAAADEALIQVYAARTYGWRGAFADHCWVAVREPGAARFVIYEVIGWRQWRGLPVVSQSSAPPSRSWYGNPARLLGEVRGAEATALLPKLEAAVASYPAPQFYRVWPGPNSNTFVAHVLREVPELGVALPPTAIGKDFPQGPWLQSTPGGKGLQLTLWGLAGVSMGWHEGVRLQWLSLEMGVNPWKGEAYWPGIGTISLW